MIHKTPPKENDGFALWRFRIRSIFVGKEGLRAGWGLILFLFLTVAVGKMRSLLSTVLHFSGQGDAADRRISNLLNAWQVVCTRLGIFVDLAVATYLMSKLEGRPLAAYGSAGPDRFTRFASGCASGLVSISALVGCLWATGFLVFDGSALRGWEIFHWGSLWALAFLAVGFAEETSLRAYMQITSTRGLAGVYSSWFRARNSRAVGFWTAAVILACLFVSNHMGNPGENPLGLAQLGLFALLMCLSLWRTGSLWWAVGFHAAFNWGEAFLFGVADSGWAIQGRWFGSHPVGNPIFSGGSAGAEGSVMAIVAWAVGVVLLLWTTSQSQLPLGAQVAGQ